MNVILYGFINNFQVLFSLYNTLPDFVTLMMGADVLTALAATLFPPKTSDDIHLRQYSFDTSIQLI